MRGIQRTNAKGLALFRTAYPGWYQGRTVHIHVKVHLGGNVLHTGQLYFPDTVTDAVYRKAPYASRPNRDVRNAGDSIYRNGGKRSQVKVSKNSAGVYVASIVMGVHRS
jgi:protocatechuate 3,4-dioxygenase beta subunit